VFGLNPNAEITYFTNATKSMWMNLINLQPRTAAGGEGGSREDYIGGMAKNIADRVPDITDISAVRRGLGGVPSPEEVVLLQEVERFNMLTHSMKGSLVDLCRALIGEIGMSEKLDSLGEALFNGFLPSMWTRYAPATEKPLGSWMTHFKGREALYNDWIENSAPKVMWLSGLHIPESYLTALVQTTCRHRNWPLDKSTLFTEVTRLTTHEEIPVKPESGCFVIGLYLEGACWDMTASHLVTQTPKVLVVELPIMQVIPIEASRLKLQGTLKTPVYVTQARKNAMGVGMCFEADLATDVHPSHWTLQGVALSLNNDE
jgi:dynein heavy chain